MTRLIYFDRVMADDASHNDMRHAMIVTQFEHAGARLSNYFRVNMLLKYERGQRSGIDTIKHHTLSRIPMGK